MVQSAQTVLFHEDVKENIEVIASMIVGADLCPHCARIVKVINYRGDKGLREFDIFVKHHTDPYGDIICPGSEKSNR